MAVNYNELALLVDELFGLVSQESKEALYRAYINRSYYVIYHHCKDYIETHLPQYKLADDGTFKTGTHNRISWFLKIWQSITKKPVLYL